MAKRKSPQGHKVLCDSPEGVRPLGRPRLRWEDRVSKDVERVEPDADWRILVEDKKRSHGTYMFVSLVLKAINYEEEKC